MPTYQFMQVDAFTSQPLQGNPCVVVLDADDLEDQAMLAIAREMNLSETAFVLRSAVADFGARYFTPAEEIPMAGHPTIATIFALSQWERISLASERSTVSLELKAGVIQVEIISAHGRVLSIVMTQLKPLFMAQYPVEEIAPLFSLQPVDILTSGPIQTVSTGTPQLMVPVRDLDALRRAQPDVTKYSAFRAKADFFSPHLFCLQGTTLGITTFARHFGVPPDLPEDPFTGSATGGMAAYLWRYGLIEEPRFTAQQGHWMNRPGEAQVELVGPPDDIQAVRVGGQAVAVMRGELFFGHYPENASGLTLR